jgi:hypothetical protein
VSAQARGLLEKIFPHVIVLDLSQARDAARYSVEGDFVGCLDATDAVANCDVYLDRPGVNALRIVRNRRIKTGIHFRSIFVSNAAQAGKTLTLVVGGPEGFDFEGGGEFSVSSIADPIFTNVLKGAQTQNNQVSVGVTSTLLRAVPANTIEWVELENLGNADVFVAVGATAATAMMRIKPGETKVWPVSGGAAGLNINGIVASGSVTVSVLAVPIK